MDFDLVSIAKSRGYYEDCLGVAGSLALILGGITAQCPWGARSGLTAIPGALPSAVG
ncbi:hypothetical protein [Caldivirga sp. MU80]|uniref:hypothetical protein n=1 Tax=Caldivirga sp. MU80 TaxID=1650354 RepID=UPI0012E93F43|nr:hypothetical protein [Caldivirga sp. MU80]